MRIFGAIGLVIFILTVQLLMPRIWEGFEETIIVFFDTARDALSAAAEVLEELPVPR